MTNEESADQSGNPGTDVDDGTACEIEHAPIMKERTVTGPRHVADGRVYDHEPERREDHDGGKLHVDLLPYR